MSFLKANTQQLCHINTMRHVYLALFWYRCKFKYPYTVHVVQAVLKHHINIIDKDEVKMAVNMVNGDADVLGDVW